MITCFYPYIEPHSNTVQVYFVSGEDLTLQCLLHSILFNKQQLASKAQQRVSNALYGNFHIYCTKKEQLATSLNSA